MKFKNILLGATVTILVSSSSVSAADYVYVKNKKNHHIVRKNACSAFGGNYINIPGTSTCINIYGKISSSAVSGRSVLRSGLFWNNLLPPKRRVGINSAAKLGFESFSKSSVGNVHTRIELRGNLGFGLGYINDVNQDTGFANSYHGNNLNSQIHFAYIDVGAWRFGVDESIFNYWANNFGNVENDSTLNPMANTPADAISYKFNIRHGLSGIVGLERSTSALPAIEIASTNKVNSYTLHMINNHNQNANLVAGIKYESKWGDMYGLAAYDGTYRKASIKLRADHNINKRFNIFGLVAFKAIDDMYIPVKVAKVNNQTTVNDFAFLRYSQLSPYGDWGGKWEAVAGASYILNPKTTFNAQLGCTEANTVAASANMVYQLAKNFTLTPELSYVAWHDNSTHHASINGEAATTTILHNVLNGEHELQALVKLCYKF